MNRRRAAGALILVGMLVVGLMITGCSSNRPVALRVAVDELPDTLDPRRAVKPADWQVLNQLYAGLTTVSADGRITGRLATDWQISPDGLVYTFHLRSDGRWSDGSPVTADDIRTAWLSVLDPVTASPLASNFYCIENAERYNRGEVPAGAVGISAGPDGILTVRLRQPADYFLAVTAATFAAAVRPTADGSGKIQPVYSGCYRVDQRDDSQLLLSANPGSPWPVTNDTVQFAAVGGMTAIAMFNDNQTDVILSGLPDAEIERLLKNPDRDMNVIRLDSPQVEMLIVNPRAPGLTERSQRARLAAAVDRQQLVDRIFSGAARPAYSLVPPSLRKAGGQWTEYTEPASVTDMAVSDGRLQFLYNNSGWHQIEAELLQAMWKERGGLEVELLNSEWQICLDRIARGKFDISRLLMSPVFLDCQSLFEAFADDNAILSYRMFGDQRIQAAVAASRTAAGEGERLAALQQVERLLLDEYYLIPLCYPQKLVVIRAGKQGVDFSRLAIIQLG
ncbi:MAG: ABC transporter substrate-binding protein [Negativicutes bacterium]|nr:ABC transporter substrate-binding protein [Negativicutes bacterium]